MTRNKVLMLLGSFVLALILVVPLIVACATPAPSPTPSPSPSPSPSPAPIPAEEVYHWRMQHWWGAAEQYLFEMFADRLEMMSDGRIIIDQLYWDGGLVPWDETHNALRAGTLDIIFDWGEPWLDNMPVSGNLEQISGILAQNIDQIWVLFGGYGHPGFGFTEILREEYKTKEDLYYIAPHFNDRSALFLKDPIDKLDDLKGRKLWMGRVTGQVLHPTGVANSVIPPEELYTSLASGLIDGVEWGACACGWDMGWHEVAKYIVVQPYVKPIVVSSYVVTPETWESLPDDLKSILEAAVHLNTFDMRTSYNYRESEKMAVMEKDWDVTAIYLPEDEQEYYRELVMNTLDEYMNEDSMSRTAGEKIYQWLKLVKLIE